MPSPRPPRHRRPSSVRNIIDYPSSPAKSPQGVSCRAARSSLSVGETSSQAFKSKLSTHQNALKDEQKESRRERLKDSETEHENHAEQKQPGKRMTWRVETFCRYVLVNRSIKVRAFTHTHQYIIPYNSVKPHLTPSSPPAKCLRSIPYELRQGQGRTYIHYWRGLVRDRIANHGVHISLSSYFSYAFLPLALGSDPPYRSLRIGCAESSAGALLWNTRRQEIDFDFTEVSDHRIYSNKGLILHKILHVEEGLVCILVPLLRILSFGILPSNPLSIQVFPPAVAQAEIYDRAAKGVVDSVLQGYNGTIFACK